MRRSPAGIVSARSCSERERRPDFDRGIGELECRWKYSDHLVWHTIQEELSSNNRTIATESPFPEAVGQDDHSVVSGDDLVRPEEAAFHRLDSQSIEQSGGHCGGEEAFGLTGAGEVGREG